MSAHIHDKSPETAQAVIDLAIGLGYTVYDVQTTSDALRVPDDVGLAYLQSITEPPGGETQSAPTTRTRRTGKE